VEVGGVEYVRLGSSGLKVSRICLGMMSYGHRADRAWHLDEDDAEPIVRRAVESGVTFFDTADTYDDGASEEVTGRLLGKLFPRRDDYVLATKVYFPMSSGPNDRGLSRRHILDGIDASLTRLGTDYVDLYQIHRWDDETPIEEIMAALHDLVRAGKVRYRVAGQCSAFLGGGEGSCWGGRQGPGSALDRVVLLFDVLAHGTWRCAVGGACEV
jgi:aryl-alcohol dehydrogenase-like predicted oxidoreductase